MLRFHVWKLAALALVAVLTGCAHPISMSPDLAAVKSSAAPIDRKVAYHFDEALRNVEVTTPGGGGDKIRYFPYRDFEPGFYKALSEVFTGVSKVPNPKDTAALQAAGVSLLITPSITTQSFSDSILTWPPTQFSIKLVCTITDAQGRPVKTLEVNADGRASFDEFKSNFSLAAVRASNDALARLIAALQATPELRR